MFLRTPLRGFGATLAVLTLTLSACAQPGEGTGAQEVAERADDVVAAFAPGDPTLVAGLVPTVYEDTARGVRAEVPVVTTARRMTSAMEVLRERGLREASWDQATDVDITYRVVASGPGTLGIVVVPTWEAESGTTTKPALVWYDAGSKRVHTSPVLIRESAWGDFVDEMTKAADRKIKKDELRAALADEAAPQGTGPMLGFDADGNLIAHFAPGVLTRKDSATVRLKADKARPLLSDFGVRAAAASQSPSVFDGAPPPGGGTVAAEPPAEDQSATERVSADPTTRPSTAVGPDCATLNCVALTFDDGPGSETPKLLATLREAKAPATFFQLGQMIKANPEMAKQVASGGHEVGAHSFSHPNLAQVDRARLQKEIVDNASVMEEAYGRKPMVFRPPFGSRNQTVDEIIHSTGAAIIQWEVDTHDWQTRDAGATTEAAVNGKDLQAGSVVLMHDIHPSTIAAAPAIVSGLQGKGMTLVTVSELSLNAESGYRAGRAYCNGTDRAQKGAFCAG